LESTRIFVAYFPSRSLTQPAEPQFSGDGTYITGKRNHVCELGIWASIPIACMYMQRNSVATPGPGDSWHHIRISTCSAQKANNVRQLHAVYCTRRCGARSSLFTPSWPQIGRLAVNRRLNRRRVADGVTEEGGGRAHSKPDWSLTRDTAWIPAACSHSVA
jgi:hypothetical protein